MPSSRRLIITPEAADDLADVVQYGAETWGVEQGSRYAEEIWATLDELSRFPEIGRGLRGTTPGLRRHLVGQHVIYYLVREDAVVVRRLVHQRQIVSNDSSS